MTEYRVSYQERPETLTQNMKGGSVSEVLEQFKKANPDAIILDVEPLRVFEVNFYVVVSYTTTVEAVSEEEAKSRVEHELFFKAEECGSSANNITSVREIKEE